MSAKNLTIEAKIIGYRRLNNTKMGNPMFILTTFAGTEHTTRANTSAAYEVENDFAYASERHPVSVILELTGLGTVTGWTLTTN